MSRVHAGIALAAAVGLGLACNVSSPAVEVPLSEPACSPDQTITSSGGDWACLDLDSVEFASVPHAEHATDAGVADHVVLADTAQLADFASKVTLTDWTFGAGSTPIDTLDLPYSGIIHDGLPVPSVGSWRSMDGGSSAGPVDSAFVGNFLRGPLEITAQGTVNSSATYPTSDGCTISITDASGTTLAKTTVHPFIANGNPTSASFALAAGWSPPDGGSSTGLSLTVNLQPTGASTCTLAPGGVLTVEEL